MNKTIWPKLLINFTATGGKIDNDDDNDDDDVDDHYDDDEDDDNNDDDDFDDDNGDNDDDDNDDHDDLKVKRAHSLVLILTVISFFTMFGEAGVIMGFSIISAFFFGGDINILYRISLATFRVK